MDPEQTAARLLAEVDVLRHATDLDLLVFFARHPRSLLASEQIASFLGYGVKEVAASLERLLEAGFLTRTPHARQVARMYVLTIAPQVADWLSAITALAMTRAGRLALISQIRGRPPDVADGSSARGESPDSPMSPPLRFPQGRSTDFSPQRGRSAPLGGTPAESKQSRGGGEP